MWQFKRLKAKEVFIDAFKSSLNQMAFEQRKPVYFGIHFANDPFLCAKSINEKPNIILDAKLQAVAIKRIKCGDEILLDYLYDNDEDVVPTEAATL